MSNRPNFDDPALVKHYGSWVRVQVAFYDFIFEHSSGLCSAHQNERAREAVMGGWSDGEAAYEESVLEVESTLSSSRAAWKAFKAHALNGA